MSETYAEYCERWDREVDLAAQRLSPGVEVCGVRCPGSTRFCERALHSDLIEHRTELTPGRTYLYWYDDSSVNYRPGHVSDPEVEYAPGSLA